MNFKLLIRGPYPTLIFFFLFLDCVSAQDKKIIKPSLEIPPPGSVQPADMPLPSIDTLWEQRRRIAAANTRQIEKMPEFPGGKAGLMKYLRKNLQYPADAAKQNIQGVVIVEFVISETGAVDSIKIKKSLSESCDSEVTRIVGNMPRWKPATAAGKPVDCHYLVPVTFSLNN